MNNVEIFRANRGEGKTKWLVEKADEAYAQGLTPIYLGARMDFDKIREVWFATQNTACPIQHIEQCTDLSFHKNCFLTDELLDSICTGSFWTNVIRGYGCKWYITMSKEDFVN